MLEVDRDRMPVVSVCQGPQGSQYDRAPLPPVVSRSLTPFIDLLPFLSHFPHSLKKLSGITTPINYLQLESLPWSLLLGRTQAKAEKSGGLVFGRIM